MSSHKSNKDSRRKLTHSQGDHVRILREFKG